MAALALCVPPLLSGCAVVDHTVALVTDLGDGLAGQVSVERPGPADFEVTPRGDRRPVAAEARSLEDYRRRIVTAYAPKADSHRVAWDLSALPPRAATPETDLERRIAPAAGAQAAPSSPPSPPAQARAARRPPPAADAPIAPPLERRPFGTSLTIEFDPRESALSERDKARLSMLAWPHLEDRAVSVRIRAYLPPPRPGIGPAPVLEVDRGRNVRRYLAHLGLPAARTELSLVEAGNPAARQHRVEVVVVGAATSAPQAATQNSASVSEDRERTISLKAFHEKLRAFTRDRPNPAALRAAPPALREAPATRPPEPRRKAPVSDPPAAPVAPLSDTRMMPRDEVAAASPARKQVVVQIASLPDRGAAESERDRISRRHAALLTGTNLTLVAVDLPGRGRYHRIRTAPLESAAAAATLCLELKARGQDCLVVTQRPTVEGQLASR